MRAQRGGARRRDSRLRGNDGARKRGGGRGRRGVPRPGAAADGHRVGGGGAFRRAFGRRAAFERRANGLGDRRARRGGEKHAHRRVAAALSALREGERRRAHVGPDARRPLANDALLLAARVPALRLGAPRRVNGGESGAARRGTARRRIRADPRRVRRARAERLGRRARRRRIRLLHDAGVRERRAVGERGAAEPRRRHRDEQARLSGGGRPRRPRPSVRLGRAGALSDGGQAIRRSGRDGAVRGDRPPLRPRPAPKRAGRAGRSAAAPVLAPGLSRRDRGGARGVLRGGGVRSGARGGRARRTRLPGRVRPHPARPRLRRRPLRPDRGGRRGPPRNAGGPRPRRPRDDDRDMGARARAARPRLRPEAGRPLSVHAEPARVVPLHGGSAPPSPPRRRPNSHVRGAWPAGDDQRQIPSARRRARRAAPLDRVRLAHAVRPRLRRAGRARQSGRGRRRGRHAGRYAAPVRRLRLGADVGLDDDQRPGAGADGDVSRGGAPKGVRVAVAARHRAGRHTERGAGAERGALPAGAVAPAHRRYDGDADARGARLASALDIGLSHRGGRRESRAGTRVHARQRLHLRRNVAGAGAAHRGFHSAALVLLHLRIRVGVQRSRQSRPARLGGRAQAALRRRGAGAGAAVSQPNLRALAAGFRAAAQPHPRRAAGGARAPQQRQLAAHELLQRDVHHAARGRRPAGDGQPADTPRRDRRLPLYGESPSGRLRALVPRGRRRARGAPHLPRDRPAGRRPSRN